MGVTVVLVRFLAGSTGGAGPSMGTLYYTEEVRRQSVRSGVAARAAADDAASSPSQAGDSTSRRVGGALENALAYVAIVAAIVRACFAAALHAPLPPLLTRSPANPPPGAAG